MALEKVSVIGKDYEDKDIRLLFPRMLNTGGLGASEKKTCCSRPHSLHCNMEVWKASCRVTSIVIHHATGHNQEAELGFEQGKDVKKANLTQETNYIRNFTNQL